MVFTSILILRQEHSINNQKQSLKLSRIWPVEIINTRWTLFTPKQRQLLVRDANNRGCREGKQSSHQTFGMICITWMSPYSDPHSHAWQPKLPTTTPQNGLSQIYIYIYIKLANSTFELGLVCQKTILQNRVLHQFIIICPPFYSCRGKGRNAVFNITTKCVATQACVCCMQVQLSTNGMQTLKVTPQYLFFPFFCK